MTQIPNLFLIGAPKCGTTALIEELSTHPEIYSRIKEPRYFDARTVYDYESDYPVKNLDQYLSFYDAEEAKNATYRVDASTMVMYRQDSINDILELSPHAKFIAILRDPLSASKSWHLHRLHHTVTRLREVSFHFEECWDLLEKRMAGSGFPDNCRNRFLFRYDLIYRYELYLPFLDRIIDPANILFINYDVYRENPALVHDSVFRFLKLNPVPIPSITANPSYVVVPNQLHKLAWRIARKTLPLRRSVGLTGTTILSIKNRLSPSKIWAKPQPGYKDEEIREFFKNAYTAMDKVCLRYAFNRDSHRLKKEK